jgi:hypothetical protein
MIEAISKYNNGQAINGRVRFDMDRIIAEGYTVGSKEYGATSIVDTLFNKNGQLVNILGKL